ERSIHTTETRSDILTTHPGKMGSARADSLDSRCKTGTVLFCLSTIDLKGLARIVCGARGHGADRGGCDRTGVALVLHRRRGELRSRRLRELPIAPAGNARAPEAQARRARAHWCADRSPAQRLRCR